MFKCCLYDDQQQAIDACCGYPDNCGENIVGVGYEIYEENINEII